jgi:catechol 2,3-dioxygenase-like lactoylglutathione lyase family enzyme
MLAGAELVSFVSASDPERVKRFYGELLGLPLAEQTAFACVFTTPNGELRVTFVEDVRPAPYTVLGWRVPDIEAAARELQARNIATLAYDGLDQDERGIWRSPSGARVLWFADADGNVLSITQR